MERDLICEPGSRSHGIAATDPPRATVERLALIVEDEWLVRLEFAEALEAAGWTVAETNSGEDALALLRKGERFHLLITDIRLHGPMTGWDVAEAFRLANPDIGIVYASGNPALEERQVAGSAFIGKPVRVDDLVVTCDRMWKSARGG